MEEEWELEEEERREKPKTVEQTAGLVRLDTDSSCLEQVWGTENATISWRVNVKLKEGLSTYSKADIKLYRTGSGETENRRASLFLKGRFQTSTKSQRKL